MSAFLLGCALFVLCSIAALAALGTWRRAECGGESSPFLGSGRQSFAIYGCLSRDAGPLIGIKKRLGLYDPAWRTVIK